MKVFEFFVIGMLTTLTAASATPPNILFILVDDLGCTDLGYTGSHFHETPHIDSLAESGMRFNQGYAASRVCSPSRASIMLGQTPPRHGITQWIGDASGLDWDKGDPVLNAEYVHNLPHEDTTIAEAFRQAGYTTFFAGKWHLGSKGSWPEDHGFMINKGGWDSGSPKGGYFAPWVNPRLESGPDGESLTLRLARETASFIDSNKDEPFFAFLSFYTVHAPIQTTKTLWEKYRDKAERMGLTGKGKRFVFDRRLPVRQVQDNPVYAGMVETLDNAVGIVLDALKRNGIDDNTIVVFTSDNGGVSSGDAYSTSLLPFRGGKGRQWQGGIHVPYIFHVPGTTPAGSISDSPVIGMDFYPTLLDLAGLPMRPEQHVDGVSLMPLLKGEKLAERNLFWHYPHYGNQGGEPSSIILSGDWKLIYYHEDGRYELYNIAEALEEQQNIASSHPEKVSQMRQHLNIWLEETGAEIPLPDPRFSQERFDERLKWSRITLKHQLERRAEEYLQEDFDPGNNWWGSSLPDKTGPDERPNIILIYADDVGYGDLGCYGAEAVDTPNLDALSETGLRFTSAYATASTCTPSRYSLLTGEYAFRNEAAEILPGNAPLIIDPARPTIASLLKKQGYTTGLVGKWHLGLGRSTEPIDWNGMISPGPSELGFDYSFHMAATGDRVPAVYIENGRIVNLDPNDPIGVSYEDPIGNDPTGISHPQLLNTQADKQHAKTIVDGTSRIGYMTGGHSARWSDEKMPDTFLDKAVDFIEANKNEPFFLYYATHENHVPRIPHPRFRGASSLGVRGDAVVQMDWSIGKLRKTLEKNGLLENTLIIFSSDNGPVLYDGYYDGAWEKNGRHKPAGPWRGGKYSAWEGGTRMPFIVNWPGTIEPGLSDALISQVDLLASLAALAGSKVPKKEAVDSDNLLDAMLGKTEVGRDYLIQQGVKMEAIRKGPWKYIPEGEVTNRGRIGKFNTDIIQAPGALYYLPEDPSEKNNVAHLYPAKVKELRALLDMEVGDNSARESEREELGGAVDE